jgi:hypothetical protein
MRKAMTDQLLTVRARFDGKEFVVTDHSPELPETYDPLLHYLATLSTLGWKAVRGKFEEWDAVLYMKKQPDAGASYMIPILHQIQFPGGRSKTTSQQKQLMSALQESGKKDGWQVLAGPKQFTIHSESWTISIWVKN